MKFFRKYFQTFVCAALALLTLAAVLLTRASATTQPSPDYEVMVDAAQIASEAMEAVKLRKRQLGIPLGDDDLLQTGMLGDGQATSITTTPGDLGAKRTSSDPNWAAVMVTMFRKAGLKKGDQIGMVFSGSFPALNICAMAAAQAYGLETCVMASVGASNYGANHEQLTFIDMAQFLYVSQDVRLKVPVDMVSLGGENDVGDNFGLLKHGRDEEEPEEGFVENYKRLATEHLLSWKEVDGAFDFEFIAEQNFYDNIGKRIDFFSQRVPKMRFFINVGGSSVGVGKNHDAYLYSGYKSHGYFAEVDSVLFNRRLDDCGMAQYQLSRGVPVASFLNIRKLASVYGIAYDPQTASERDAIGVGDVYNAPHYDIALPIVALTLTAAALVVCFIYKKNYTFGENVNERNHILHRR